uniref:Glyco_hydro_38C domain-containing protein n=1 Tax=Ascaris lumbricoides TaxID=6252 RepID=A0A0M3ICS9_ASCLU
MHPNSRSANVHPILVGPELNITITTAFDNSLNRLTVVVARNDVGSGISSQLFYIENATSRNFGSGCELHTAIDMGRGLLHIVIEDSAKQMLGIDYVNTVYPKDSDILLAVDTTAWLYEGSTKRTGGAVKEFEKIGLRLALVPIAQFFKVHLRETMHNPLVIAKEHPESHKPMTTINVRLDD